jgi:hypothetical protein
MAERDFAELQGNSYRGSRYTNFVGGGVTPQGNVSNGVTENSNSAVASKTPAKAADAPPSQIFTPQGEAVETPSAGSALLATALPYAGNVIGQAAGSAIGAGASFGTGISEGFSTLANKVSGGLLGGVGSTSTNSALSGLGGKLGPATAGQVAKAGGGSVSSFGSKANIGGAVGTGIGAAVGTLLTGGSIADAAKSGVGTAAGTAIGTAVAGPIGGFVGGFIGGTIFCFAAGTEILMADESIVLVEDLDLNDEVFFGGRVLAVGKALEENIFLYKGVVLVGNHAVFEDGKWIRVNQSEQAKPFLSTEEMVVYPIVTEHHILVTSSFVSADILEVDEHILIESSYQEILDYLNAQTERNATLTMIEKEILKK